MTAKGNKRGPEIVWNLQSGDLDNFNQIFIRYGHSLFGLVYKYLKYFAFHSGSLVSTKVLPCEGEDFIHSKINHNRQFKKTILCLRQIKGTLRNPDP